MMESGESPLDVLSRAAIMVQDNSLPPSYDEARVSKCREEAGGKWRRQKPRKDPPDYSAHFPRVGREPIDLSTRKLRGSPPSYSQTIANQKRTTVISTPTSTRTVTDCSGGVCDPMIDEHFRRSLGKDYLAGSDPAQASQVSTGDSSSLSVDDHFAKALGLTEDHWRMLQTEAENKKSDNDEIRRS